MSNVQSPIISGIFEIVNIDGKSRPTRMYASYPLRFIYSGPSTEKCASLFMLGFGGGMVSGDVIDIQGVINQSAIACLRTQGSTKIFKCPTNLSCHQSCRITMYNNSLLIFAPDPISCYKQSEFSQHQEFSLHSSANLIFVDWYTSGRSSRGEIWDCRRIRSFIEVSIEDTKIFRENMDLFDSKLATIYEKVGGVAVFGMILLIGPKLHKIYDIANSYRIREDFHDIMTAKDNFDRNIKKRKVNVYDETSTESNAHQSSNNQNINITDTTTSINNSRNQYSTLPVLPTKPLISVTKIQENAMVLRFAATQTEDIYALLVHLLSPLREVIGYIPYEDRLHLLDK